tara:strand:- start:50 stop:367 length:318 start_codon:yes stop_codon:yes gene_type:complete
MSIGNNVMNSTTRFFLALLILSQLSNALLLVNLFEVQEKIVLNSDIDNNSKEDKNNIDITEESKIFEAYFHAIFILDESSTSNYLAQNFIEVLSSKDFPPPELNS